MRAHTHTHTETYTYTDFPQYGEEMSFPGLWVRLQGPALTSVYKAPGSSH